MIQVEQHGPVIAIRMARRFLGKPLYWTAAYWIDGLLIDTGPAATAAELLRVLEQVSVRQIALTHGHEDHIGGLAALRRKYPNAPVYASLRTIELAKAPDRLQMQLYRKLVWGVPQPVEGLTVLEEVADVIHTQRFALRAVETPGHSQDHVAYFEPHLRWLFAGDAFIGGRDRTWAPEFDLFGVVGSLRTLALLDPERLFPGSGNVRRNPLNDINDKLLYLTGLARDVAKLDAAGIDAAEIAERLLAGDSRMSFWTQGHFSALNLIEACRSYNALVQPLPGASRRGVGAAAGAKRTKRGLSSDPSDPIR